MNLDDIYEQMVFEMGYRQGLEEVREEAIREFFDLAIRRMLLLRMGVQFVSNMLDVRLERVQAFESALRESGELTDCPLPASHFSKKFIDPFALS